MWAAVDDGGRCLLACAPLEKCFVFVSGIVTACSPPLPCLGCPTSAAQAGPQRVLIVKKPVPAATAQLLEMGQWLQQQGLQARTGPAQRSWPITCGIGCAQWPLRNSLDGVRHAGVC